MGVFGVVGRIAIYGAYGCWLVGHRAAQGLLFDAGGLDVAAGGLHLAAQARHMQHIAEYGVVW